MLPAASSYGERGDTWALKILELADAFSPRSILDHGCGRGALKRALFMVVSTRLAVKTLADGRIAQLIVEPANWWRPRLAAGMSIAELRDLPDEFAALLIPAA
jgi:hypothetical protein